MPKVEENTVKELTYFKALKIYAHSWFKEIIEDEEVITSFLSGLSLEMLLKKIRGC